MPTSLRRDGREEGGGWRWAVFLYLLGQSFGQVFGGFCLARPSRTLWGAPEIQLQSPH